MRTILPGLANAPLGNGVPCFAHHYRPDVLDDRQAMADRQSSHAMEAG